MNKKHDFFATMSIKSIKLLYFYFFTLLLLSVILSIFILVLNSLDLSLYFPKDKSSLLAILYDSDTKNLNRMILSIFGSIGTSVLGCSIYYIRKLYKLSLADRFIFPSADPYDKLKGMGALFYFISRPFFTIAFTLLLLLGFKASLFTIMDSSIVFSSGFCDICMFISFFMGFATGDFLSSIEKKANYIANNLLDNTNINL